MNPTDVDFDDPTDEDRDSEYDGPSRSQVRREALAVRFLVIEIGELSPAARAKLPLPEEIVEGMEELDRIKHKNARKRHVGFLTKKMRKIDIGPIEAAMDMQRQAARANSYVHHSIEHWRDRLMGVDEQPNPKGALTDFLNEYPHAERQSLAQLQRKVLQEIKRASESPDFDSSAAQRQPPAARELFKFVRTTLTQTPNP